GIPRSRPSSNTAWTTRWPEARRRRPPWRKSWIWTRARAVSPPVSATPVDSLFSRPFLMLLTLFAFLLALGLLVTFHELGHYWVARRAGVPIVRFSVGFGPILLRRHDRRGTEWALSAIPL